MNALAAATHLAGRVDRIRCHKPATSWSVVDITTADGRHCTITGCMDCAPGQTIEAEGRWVTKPGYGEQFEARSVVAANPVTPEGVVTWLGSGALPGIGPALAVKVYQHFGMRLFDVLDSDPARLREVQGIGKAKAAAVAVAWSAAAMERRLQLLLTANGLPLTLLRRIRDALGANAVAILRADPYALCRKVRGIGFQTADRFAQQVGMRPDNPRRLRAGLGYQLRQLTRVGHCGAPRAQLVKTAAGLLATDENAVREALAQALTAADPDIVLHGECVYPTALADAERAIAGTLLALAGVTPAYAGRVTNQLLASAASRCGMTPTDLQAQAARMALTHAVSVITGGPGCGKTATLKIILAAFDMLGVSVALAAPTGKAAQRAQEATGVTAGTIHRLLRIKAGTDAETADDADADADAVTILDDDPDHDGHIRADVLVVDEASMLDVPLLARVVRAMQDSTSLLLVGDVDQLPSVGPGRVLADIIDSGAVPVTVLDQIFRQAAGSAIITNAYAINHGEEPRSADRNGDFFLLTERNTRSLYDAQCAAGDLNPDPDAVPRAAADLIESLVAERLPRKYGVSALDIQVLAPMRKGACGVLELNRRLQARLNPDPLQSVAAHHERFGIGDRVLQTHNNYALGIFNGDTGVVEGIGANSATLAVRFGGRVVDIPLDALNDLTLAYAMTIHKSQGSQTPIVVIPMLTAHWIMLQRNLLYTAITRARNLAVVVGQTRAIRQAVATVTSTRRVTRLCELLSTRETLPNGRVSSASVTVTQPPPLRVVEVA